MLLVTAEITALFLHLYKKNSELSSLFLIVCLVFSVSACSPPKPLHEHEFSGQIMGTYFRVKMLGDKKENLQALDADIEYALGLVNQSMSNYIESSEINQFNRMSAHQRMALSADFAQVIGESIELAKLSGGAFDVTISPLINAWGFGEQGSIERQPSPTQLKQIAQRIGYQHLNFQQGTLSKLVDGLELNVSAIAKGYAVDKVSELLASAGIDDFMVDIGGEIRANGVNLQGKGWQIAIEQPSLLGGVQQLLSLKDQAIATSGDYRNFLIVDGEQFSHTINPVSLAPSLHKLASVSVIAERCSRADALATAIMVMGEEQGFAFAQKHQLAAYMLVRSRQSDQYSILMTEEFRRILQ